MRGEHRPWFDTFRIRWGSSPHARGTPGNPSLIYPGEGIIPACAGNTSGWVDVMFIFGDHPRMRGEHSSRDSRQTTIRGSSPHARGTRRYPRCRQPHAGIIPACAGNTSSLVSFRSVCGDHPRMRGEHQPEAIGMVLATGSSPHARGTLLAVQFRRVALGIIPACAGNTNAPMRYVPRNWDHPRMRGEHSRSVEYTSE